MDAQTTQQTAADALLQSLIGNWEGTNKVWFAPDSPTLEAPITGTIRAQAGSRFVIHENQSTVDGNPSHGTAIYCFNSLTNKFESAWVDSFHMTPYILNSVGDATERGFSVLASYQMAADQPAWGWRTAVELVDPDTLMVRCYNITPEGQEYLGVEIAYKRVNVATISATAVDG